jgi:anti-sigma-K factor RskA
MDCDQVREQLDAFAVGALEPDEQREIERHLEGCPDCREMADRLVTAANLLPLALAAASPVTPPAGLKERVLAAVPAKAPPAAEPDRLERAESRTRRRFWNSRTLAAAAALALLVVSLVLGVRLSQALDREEAVREQVREVFTQQQELVLEVVDSDKTQRVILRAVSDDSNAYGKLYTRSDLPHVVVMAARLPPPPEGQSYHLWLTKDGKTEPAGVLMLNDQGFGLVTFDADENGPVYDAALLTLQPPGDDAPSGETVLAWPSAE